MKSRKNSFKQWASIFWTFFKIGPVTFGGGYAMIPAIEREVVDKQQWITHDEMSGVLSVAGSAPGGIGVNAASFIGYRLAGIPGAAAAVAGITLPTFVIVFLLSLGFSQVVGHPKVTAAFQGIQGAIAALILISAYNMGKTSVVDRTTLATAASTVVLLLVFHFSPIALIVVGLVIGHLLILIKNKLGVVVSFNNELAAATTSTSYKYSDYYIADGI
ncbi:chromate transporter [Paenibacillus sp. PvR098]|uniref:chromate transporter n=1 Tax=unclassified Paenibacillus TaxID=185978 RepID=UPI001B45C487|nr:chromate transporter [Paenibacillus sp. PvP091]MBP1168700.1 chromate transporter [Paenibacillus sp. PvR098]MBP2439728.1 chromate transporter [Paenibacillus sp. PvP052]